MSRIRIESELADSIREKMPQLKTLGGGDSLVYAAELLLSQISGEALSISAEDSLTTEKAVRESTTFDFGGYTDDEKRIAVSALLCAYTERMEAVNEETNEHWQEQAEIRKMNGV